MSAQIKDIGIHINNLLIRPTRPACQILQDILHSLQYMKENQLNFLIICFEVFQSPQGERNYSNKNSKNSRIRTPAQLNKERKGNHDQQAENHSLCIWIYNQDCQISFVPYGMTLLVL